MNDGFQSIEEHMVKFEDRSGKKQYIKKKQSSGVSSSSITVQVHLAGYLYQLKTVEMNFGKILVLNMSEVLENSYCKVYFDHFFNSPLLISKLLKK